MTLFLFLIHFFKLFTKLSLSFFLYWDGCWRLDLLDWWWVVVNVWWLIIWGWVVWRRLMERRYIAFDSFLSWSSTFFTFFTNIIIIISIITFPITKSTRYSGIFLFLFLFILSYLFYWLSIYRFVIIIRRVWWRYCVLNYFISWSTTTFTFLR